jgi:hypothetical protein
MAHIQAPDKECLLQIVHTLNDEMQSERPEHSRLDKLICLKVCPVLIGSSSEGTYARQPLSHAPSHACMHPVCMYVHV